LSGLFFPLLTGYLVDRVSYAPVFAMVALMPLIGASLLFIAGRQYRIRNRNAVLTIRKPDDTNTLTQ
jgi:MFS transporter, ACS family, hexuronate transporter